MSIVRDAKLAFWQAKGKNVLLVGLQGVGKTQIIRESLEKNEYKFGESAAYYSTHAGDFVGDPSTAQVIVFDDLNDPQAQKAAHEIISLKVWKGKPVTAFVWASYTNHMKKVETKLPDARGQYRERTDYEWVEAPELVHNLFEVVVEVPYKPDAQWFTDKFGKRATDAILQWWEELPEDLRYEVSPRKLCQALSMWEQRGDMRDVLPVTSNVSKLCQLLNTGPLTEKLDSLAKSKNEAEARSFLANENNCQAALKYIPKTDEYMAFFLPLLPQEKLAVMLEDDKASNYIISNANKVEAFKNVCRAVLEANAKTRLVKKIRRSLAEQQSPTGNTQ